MRKSILEASFAVSTLLASCGNQPQAEVKRGEGSPPSGQLYYNAQLSNQEQNSEHFSDGVNSFWIKAIEENGVMQPKESKLLVYAGINGEGDLSLGTSSDIPLYLETDLSNETAHEATVYIKKRRKKVEVGTMQIGYHNGNSWVQAPAMKSIKLCEEEYANNCRLDVTVESSEDLSNLTEDSDVNWWKNAKVSISLKLNKFRQPFKTTLGSVK